MSDEDQYPLDRFFKQVEDHEMTVVQDDGVHRHLHFHKGRKYVMHFRIVTFPHHLLITGDMGSYLFTRIPDMFEFFRLPEGQEFTINTGYWAEKLLAVDNRTGGSATEFSNEKFEEGVREYVKGYLEYANLEECDAEELWDKLDEEVLCGHSSQYEASHAVWHFSWPEGDSTRPKFYFEDFYGDGQVYTYCYIWCCRAIRWAIQQYDKYKEDANERL